MSVLLPCPFCGSIEIEDHYIFMECAHCHSRGPVQNNGRFDDHADFRDRELAIEGWNNRPTSPPTPSPQQ